MATAPIPPFLAVEEYVDRVDRGERLPDYVEGRLVERAVPSEKHSECQGVLVGWFWERRTAQDLYVRPEIHLQAAADRIRIADVAIFWRERPNGPIPTNPPLIVAEVISPSELFRDLFAKLEDYQSMGVRHVWAVEPEERKLFEWKDGGLQSVDAYYVPELETMIGPDQIFEAGDSDVA